jgi:hypothetical protein
LLSFLGLAGLTMPRAGNIFKLESLVKKAKKGLQRKGSCGMNSRLWAKSQKLAAPSPINVP